jgi:hypothetical protein
LFHQSFLNGFFSFSNKQFLLNGPEKPMVSKKPWSVAKWDNLKGETHVESFVWWLEVERKHANAFDKRLATATKEEDLQAFLEKYPMVLIQHLGGGHGRWVIPKKRLGSEFITDFVIGQKDSNGYEWHAVELESPNAKMFTKAGDPTAQLTHAIRQIQDWRSWLGKNQNYGARPVEEHGLGLTGITANLSGFIFIGRRQPEDRFLERRRQMMDDLNIEFHSYDFLSDNARWQAEALRRIQDKYNPKRNRKRKSPSEHN